MAKEIVNFEIVLRGDVAADGPHTLFAQYVVQDGELRSDRKVKDLSGSGMSKKLHDAGSTGEFWRDVFDSVKDGESI